MIIRLFILLVLVNFSWCKPLFAQQDSFDESINFEGDPYGFDSTSFEITEIENRLKEPHQLGIIHFGEKEEEVKLLLKPDLEKQFDKFFREALKKTEVGDLKTKLVFKELSVNVNTEDSTTLSQLAQNPAIDLRIKKLGVKNWRNRKYRIKVDYLIKGHLVYSDSMSVDSFAHISEYSVDQFCTHFFKNSLHRLNQKVIALQSDSNSLLTQIEEEAEARAAEAAAKADYEKELIDLKVRLKYKNESKMKVLPAYIPEEIKARIKQDYAESDFGFYKLMVVYQENKDELEIIGIEQKSFSSIQEVRTRRIVVWSVVGIIGFISSYNSAREPVGPGPPSRP